MRGVVHNDVGPIVLRPMSEFDIIHKIRHGDEADVRRRLARGRTGLRNVARVFTRCKNLFDLHGDQERYWEASDRAITLCNEEGYYFSPVILVDNWEMTRDQRRAWVHAWVTRYRTHPGIWWGLVNEPEQQWQGFSGPTDPELLEYAQFMRDTLGHKDFIIGAAADGDNEDASAETTRLCIEVSKHCNFPATHSSRKGGATPEGSDGRIRRWVDHLEAAYDITVECRKVNPDVVFYQEESMGHASQQWVPIGNGRTYEREWEPEVALMAAVTSESAEQIYCYHYISSQDDGTPGLDLIGQVLVHYPAGWKYRNDSWPGAPSRGFDGGEGKVRHLVAAPDGRTLGYTRTGTPSVDWANGFEPKQVLYQGRYATVWIVRQ